MVTDADDELIKAVSYKLDLHYKQGDDFAHHLEHAKNNLSGALLSWAESFERNRVICTMLARVLDGKKIDVQADVHFISFTAEDDAAEEALLAMAKEGCLEREVYDEDGEPSDDGEMDE